MTLNKATKVFNSLKEKWAMLFENPSKKSIAFLRKIKAKLMEFRSNHQRDGDDIETKLFAV